MLAIPPLTRRVASRLLAGWLLVRTLAWTLVALTQANPPLDTVEWVAWGRHWQAGYHKHPPLAAWLAELASLLCGGSFVGPYLLGYLCVAVALWCVWRVAADLLPSRAALAATLCLDGLTHLTRDAAEFNNQVVLIAFWALAVACCWRAVTTDRWRWWIATGVALGAALWCKYTAVFLAVSLGAFWLWHDRGRRLTQVLLVAGTCAVVFLPHLLWLIGHDFVTLHYAADRVYAESETPAPRLSALTFLASQAARLLPVALVLTPFVKYPAGRKRPASTNKPGEPGWAEAISSEGLPLQPGLPGLFLEAGRSPPAGSVFLLFAVVGPVALHVVAALALGVQLRDVWGVPLWAFAGVLLCSLLKMDESSRTWRLFLRCWAAVAVGMMLVTLTVNVAGSACRHRPLRTHYPGPQLAREVQQRWRDEFGTPLPVAGGDWWLAACVCVHADDRPTLYGSREPAAAAGPLPPSHADPGRYCAPDPRASPWIDDEAFRQRGGVLLWDAGTFGDDLPRAVKQRFPDAQVREPLTLPFAGGSGRSLRVGWAVMPPSP